MMNDYLVHVVQTLQATSVRLILAYSSILASKYGLRTLKLLISSAQIRLQEIYIYIYNPAEELELETEQCFSC